MAIKENKFAVYNTVKPHRSQTTHGVRSSSRLVREMEMRTMVTLELARELERFFGTALAAMNTPGKVGKTPGS